MALRKRRGLIVSAVLALAALAVVLASGKTLLEEWHIACLRSKDEETRKAAASALASMKCYRAVPQILELLRDADDVEGSTEYAFEALEKLSSPEAVPFFTRALAHPDRCVALYAALCLLQSGEPAKGAVTLFVESLEAMPENPARRLRDQTFQILRRIGAKPKALSVLAEGLKDPAPQVRQKTLEVLRIAMLPPPTTGDHAREVLPGLVQALADPAVEVRGFAADLIGCLGGLSKPENLTLRKALARLLRDPDDWVRRQALTALCRLGAASNALLEAMEDPDPGVRRFALVHAWARTPGEKSRLLEVLKKLSGDTDPDVRAAAKAALGEDAGE